MRGAMMRLSILIMTIFLLSLATGPQARAEDSLFAGTLRKFTEICENAGGLIETGPDGKRSTFEIMTFQEPRYTRLLEEARGVLEVSDISAEFNAIDSLRLKNRDMENDINELRRKRISAPEESFNPLVRTRKRIDAKIAERQEDIARNNAEIASLKENLAGVLASHGINFTEEEIDYFLLSAEGNELIKLMTIADNMKRIQAIMESELESEPGNISLAKIYAGMYLLSLDAYANAHDVAMNNIAAYRARLGEIVSEAKNIYREAKKLRRSSSGQDMSHLDANMRLNERTMEVSRLYDRLLERRTANLEKSRGELAHKIKIARNTYKTIINGGALVEIVNKAANDYALLINFEMPELKNLHETGMLGAFADISDKIRREK